MTDSNRPQVRAAEFSDLSAITEIYNEAIVSTTATFDLERKTIGQQHHWLAAHGPQHPVLVAELDGQVVGWASIGGWSDRPAYRETGESSVYVKEEFRRRGVGNALLEATIDAGRRVGLHTLIARIADGNPGSVQLHEKHGYQRIGVMKEVGHKFSRRLDVELFQRMLGD